MTSDRAKELIDSMDDETLIDIATTSSRKDIALAAEMHLRKRYPSHIKRPDYAGMKERE